MASSSTEAAKSIDSISDEMEELNKASGDVASSLNSAANSSKLVSKALKVMFVDIGAGAVKMALDYNDAARKSIRGTSLMGTTAEEMTKRVSALNILGPKVASSLALGSEEASKMSTNLLVNMQRMNSSMNIGEASKQVQDYSESVKGSAMMLGMGVDEMTASQDALMGRARLNISDMKGLMQEASGYAATMGLEGKDMNEMIVQHMDTIMALDQKSRKEYISDLAYTAGVQKRAAVDFGKFSTSLAKQTGTEAMTSEATLSALSGVDMGTVAWALSQASVNAEAAKEQQNITEKSLATTGVSLDEYRDLYSQRAANTLDAEEAARLRTLEIMAGPVTKIFNKDLPELLGMKSAVENIEQSSIPTQEESRKAGEAMASEKAQKQLQDSLITTDELTRKYSAVMANVAITAIDATKSLNLLTDAMRTMTAVADSGDKATGGGISKMLDGMGGIIGGIVGSALGPLAGKVLKSGGRFVGGLFGRGGGNVVENLAESATKKVAGKEIAENVAESATKKVVGKEMAEVAAEKAGKKILGKTVAKTAGKSALKKIPLIGALVGAGLGIERVISEGDWMGGGLELASGLLGTLPGLGTAASFAVDAYSAKRDIDKEMEKSSQVEPEVVATTDTTPPEEGKKESELTKQITRISNVEDSGDTKDNTVEAFERAIGGIQLTGIERNMAGSRRVMENIIPILSDMRDSMSTRQSSLVAAF